MQSLSKCINEKLSTNVNQEKWKTCHFTKEKYVPSQSTRLICYKYL